MKIKFNRMIASRRAVNEFYRMTRMGVAGHVTSNRTEANE